MVATQFAGASTSPDSGSSPGAQLVGADGARDLGRPGFLGLVALGGLGPVSPLTVAVLAAAGSLAGSRLMQTKVTGVQRKRFIGVLLWVIAAKIAWDPVR